MKLRHIGFVSFIAILVLFVSSAFCQNGVWTTRAPMLTARDVLGVGVINGKVYAAGGILQPCCGPDVAAVEVYDPVADSWASVAPMPQPTHAFGVGVVNGVLYAVGGHDFGCNCPTTTLQAYDPNLNTWTIRAPMPTAREGVAVGVINGIIYAVGGVAAGGVYLPTVEAYDPASNSWSAKAQLLTPRYAPAAGSVDGILYVAGGSYFGAISSVEAYDPVANTWSYRTSMPTARYFAGGAVVNENFYVIGGDDNSNNPIPTAESYDHTTDSWSELAPMPTARIPDLGVVNGVIYALGGFSPSSGDLATNEAFTPTSPGVALLSGGNTFVGNQAVNGNVSASFFFGDGSGLLNLNPASLSPGTAAINITGTAAAAISANNAGNASNLGGISAGSYARLDIGNAFNGDQTITGNLTASGNSTTAGTTSMGGGTPIVEHVSLKFNPTFPALKPTVCVAATFTFAGASDGDTLALGVPNARTTGGGNVVYFAWVSAPNTITIQGCNVGAAAQKIAGTGAIRVDLWKH